VKKKQPKPLQLLGMPSPHNLVQGKFYGQDDGADLQGVCAGL
jgi:hypothetical protein